MVNADKTEVGVPQFFEINEGYSGSQFFIGNEKRTKEMYTLKLKLLSYRKLILYEFCINRKKDRLYKFSSTYK